MVGNVIKKNERDKTSIVKKLHNFMILKCWIQISQMKGKKIDLLGMWVFQLDLFCDILDNVCSSLENKDEVVNKTFVNIKNFMSDQL